MMIINEKKKINEEDLLRRYCFPSSSIFLRTNIYEVVLSLFLFCEQLALISNRANCLSVFCSLRRQYPFVFTQNFPTYQFWYIFNEFGLKH